MSRGNEGIVVPYSLYVDCLSSSLKKRFGGGCCCEVIVIDHERELQLSSVHEDAPPSTGREI